MASRAWARLAEAFLRDSGLFDARGAYAHFDVWNDGGIMPKRAALKRGCYGTVTVTTWHRAKVLAAQEARPAGFVPACAGGRLTSRPADSYPRELGSVVRSPISAWGFRIPSRFMLVVLLALASIRRHVPPLGIRH